MERREMQQSTNSKCIVGQEWGTDKQSMITIYCALIQSVLDYGCIIYGSASIIMLKVKSYSSTSTEMYYRCNLNNSNFSSAS